MSSYASDLRAAAEAEKRELTEPFNPDDPLSELRRTTSRIALTTPDRLLPLLDRLEQLERVAEAAKANVTKLHMRHWHTGCDCLGNASLCCVADCPCRALDALDREAR